MKRIVSISLSIFLVVGAVVLFSGGPEAKAGTISSNFIGQWSCINIITDHTILDGSENVSVMNISQSGTVTDRGYIVIHGPGWANWVSKNVKGTATEGPWPFITLQLTGKIGGVEFTSTSKCIGQLKNSKYGFERMECVTIHEDQNGQFAITSECIRTTAFPTR